MSYLEEIKKEMDEQKYKLSTAERLYEEKKELYKKAIREEYKSKCRFFNDDFLNIMESLECNRLKVVCIQNVNHACDYNVKNPFFVITNSYEDFYYILCIDEETADFYITNRHSSYHFNPDGGSEHLYNAIQNFVNYRLVDMYNEWSRKEWLDNEKLS